MITKGEYKTIKRNGDEGIRTFTVNKVNHKVMKVEVSGAINGIYNIITDYKGLEYIALNLNNTMYCNPCELDRI